jgi:hypothetical protein
MQTASRFWTKNARRHPLRPVRLRVGLGTLGETMARCHRCGIPLGSGPCPNPLCPEQHGQSAGGEICAWCSQNHEARIAMLDVQLYDGQTDAANYGVSHTESRASFRR